MCEAEQLCLDAIDHHWAGVVFEALLLIYCFIALAIVCDRHLVVSLETLCVRWNVREDVAGCTFMAFGSAAPEILINTIGTIKGGDNSDLGVGAIIGSGMIAFLVIPGVCGLAAARTLQLKRRPLLRDATVYLVALILLCVFFYDGVIKTWEAACLVGLYVLYIVFVFLAPGVRRHYKAFTHRKKLWHTIRRAVASGVDARGLTELRESFLRPPTLQPKAKMHFVVEAAVAKKKEEDEAKARLSASPPPINAAQSLTVPVHSNGRDRGMVSSGSDVELSDSPRREASPDGNGNGAVHGGGSSSSGGYANVHQYDDDDSHRLSVPAPALSPSSDNDDIETLDPLTSSTDLSTLQPMEAPATRAERAFDAFVFPLTFLFEKTCKPCEWDSPSAKWYPLTFLVSFFWVSLFSFVLSTVVGRWVELSGVSQGFFGLVLVAMGAEIPDLIQSVTVAKRGYGSMAVANSCGSQITNILIGLGFPWLLRGISVEAGSGEYVEVSDHKDMQIAAFFQFTNIALFVALLLLAAVIQNTKKAQLTKTKGVIFLVAYCCCISGYAIYKFA